MMLLRHLRRLRKAGVLGVNARNADYVLAHNERARLPQVNCKLATKKLAEQHGIPVPALFGTIAMNGEIRRLARFVEKRESFVVKPAQGAGGDGILVVTGRVNGHWRRHDGMRLDSGELDFHLSNILSGMYSLGGRPDRAFVEACVKFDPVFDELTTGGVPDVRVLVYRGVPAMAMVRLPTRESDGKANLHKGGVGLGIDLATGRTRNGVCHDQAVEEHPDSGAPLNGVLVPCWEELLHMAARCYDITGLGYLGVDMVLDREHGPLLLELNARPGLAIQIANGAGLRSALARIDRHAEELKNPAARVDFALDRLSRLEPAAPIRLEPRRAA
jgi:alpha-L-glutamate ligase-like protein